MTCVFEVIDKTGRKIYMPVSSWKHINLHHPDVSNKFEDIKDVVITPLIIKQDIGDEGLHYYYKYFKSKRTYLLVLVRYLNGEGFIITSFYVKNIK